MTTKNNTACHKTHVYLTDAYALMSWQAKIKCNILALLYTVHYLLARSPIGMQSTSYFVR